MLHSVDTMHVGQHIEGNGLLIIHMPGARVDVDSQPTQAMLIWIIASLPRDRVTPSSGHPPITRHSYMDIIPVKQPPKTADSAIGGGVKNSSRVPS